MLSAIHLLTALKSFSTISCLGFLFFLLSLFPFLSASESACGLRLFKCSLPITSCLITYLLDLLSCIYSLKEKAKEKCRLSSSHRALKDLKEVKKTLFLINNFQMTAPIPVKKKNTLEDTGVAVTKAFKTTMDTAVKKIISHTACKERKKIQNTPSDPGVWVIADFGSEGDAAIFIKSRKLDQQVKQLC